ncbi:MAG: BatD family protein [Gemmatimonadetes bacterium]|nr:BatD family protein [Gemmatimonadota bacterium]
MIALALLAALVAQDTTALSPRARDMLGRFPLPAAAGGVSIAVRFSKDTAWVGEQVELVTAAWFPRELRDRLRRPPTLRGPSLSGLWSVQSQSLPILVETRRARGEVYDLFVMHQTIFPLGPGRIVSPPALLSYAVPASASYFAPEERKSLTSRTATLQVRPIPAAVATMVAGGPTTRNLRLVWRGPPEGLHAGTPALVELVANGTGNVTLWPTPSIAWPSGLRVYPERTEETTTIIAGDRGGEKRFRFTIVADSEGVVTLPAVRYPTFDPSTVSARVVAASAFALPVFTSPGRTGDRTPLAVTGQEEIPLATRLVRTTTAMWVALLTPGVLLALWWRRRRPRRAIAIVQPVGDPERELYRLLGTPIEASSDRVVAALRHRGVPRPEAEQVRRWLAATGRRRYGPVGGSTPEPPAAVSAVLSRLRRATTLLVLCCVVTAPLAGQATDPVSRYRAGDFRGAARLFEAQTIADPRAAGSWRDLGSARWQAGDDVGAVAAWWRALSLAPRDRLARQAWRDASTLPASMQRLVPTIPISRDECVLLAVLGLGTAWLLHRFGHRRQAARVVLLMALGCGALGLFRWRREVAPVALVREAIALRVSPHPAAPVLAQASAWALVEVERRDGKWLLVATPEGGRGWLPEEAIAPLATLD